MLSFMIACHGLAIVVYLHEEYHIAVTTEFIKIYFLNFLTL